MKVIQFYYTVYVREVFKGRMKIAFVAKSLLEKVSDAVHIAFKVPKKKT